ncbi:MAG: Lrp/AsnC family transcriptional regulator [Thermoplasmata archaeon]|nr:Lrp/AsnC family transcriptional regulator [Euryarchaeota archaeon]RLF64589.1 MAG: Lrp/AsnC family transcriptional regulator [Thermoplasmata archaeon]
MGLDQVDIDVLKNLIINSRMTISEIAKRISRTIAKTTVHYRIQKLEKEGIIKKYTVELNYDKLGYPVLAYILATYDPNVKISQKDLIKRISKIPGVERVYIVTGDWDLIIEVRAKSVRELGDLIVDRLRVMPGILRTMTCIVLHSAGDGPLNILENLKWEKGQETL